MAIHAANIRDEIQKYLRGARLSALQEWFVPVSISIEQTGTPSAIRLAYQIDGLLAEASSAGWDEEELRAELANAIGTFALIQMPVVERPALLKETRPWLPFSANQPFEISARVL